MIRFAPTDPGEWAYRVSSNVARFQGKQGTVVAVAGDSQGHIRTANVHHWAYTEVLKAHLWMGDTCLRLATIPRKTFEAIADARAAQKFNHMRGYVVGDGADAAKAYAAPDQPNPAYFQELDQRVIHLNNKGIIADLVLAAGADALRKLFPTWQDRDRFVRYVAARYTAMNVTWLLAERFEDYTNGRELLKEVGALLRKYDAYRHPASAHAAQSSAPMLGDGWMNFVAHGSPDVALGSVEHQLYQTPFVNLGIGSEDSGAGGGKPHQVSPAEFRRRLWHATMNGQYPVFSNTGTAGEESRGVDANFAESPGAKAMTVWWDLFSKTRHWELEPYFDVDNGRAIALEGVEYIVYVEKPALVEVLVEKHEYDVYWINPATGEAVRPKDKQWKGERFVSEPPDNTHDWVLHLSRDGRKQGMLNSYRFDSRMVPVQEVEQTAARVPFEIGAPTADPLRMSGTTAFAAKLKRETRATRAMLYLWTAEAAADGQGYRVVATGASGTFEFPRSVAVKFPAVLNLRLTGMNANGKVYSVDRVFRLTE